MGNTGGNDVKLFLSNLNVVNEVQADILLVNELNTILLSSRNEVKLVFAVKSILNSLIVLLLRRKSCVDTGTVYVHPDNDVLPNTCISLRPVQPDKLLVTLSIGNDVLFTMYISRNVEPVGTVTFKSVKLLLVIKVKLLNELLPEKL